MANEATEEDKQHEASSKKLEDARKRGEVPRSTDLNNAAAYCGLLLAGASLGVFSFEQVANVLIVLLGQADKLAPVFFQHGTIALSGGLLGATAEATWSWFFGPMVLVLLSVIIQRSLVFAPSKLQPKLSRISILSNAKNKFGRTGLFEFLKSTVKLTVISVILFFFLWARTEEIIHSLLLSPGAISGQFLRLGMEFLAVVAFVSLVIGLIDYLWQYSDHLRKNRMSHKELRDEAKESEGDPYLKQQRRQRAMEAANNQSLQDVPTASVVIVNPTHYAVALRWDQKSASAPVCVAKGVDELAARVREIAQEAGVPIHRDPPTARALHASVAVGAEIEEEHYQPVAVAIRFAEEMRQKARRSYTSGVSPAS
ncbi:MAG: flagellar type III secretion system protein FlhB [Pseudomonadota bacterium]